MDLPEVFETKFELQATHLIGLFFALGLTVGFASGTTFKDLTAPRIATSDTPQPDTGSETDTNSGTLDLSNINNSRDPVLGQEDAEVTMVIYEDFECPFCKRFESGAVPQIENNYVRSGEVKIVWKDFPLQRIHPWATRAAETAECVYRQDEEAFWNVKDTVFDNQESLSESNVVEKIKGWASEEDVSPSAVQSCLDNGNPRDAVRDDMEEATSFDTMVGGNSFVSGTPSVVIYSEGDQRGEPLVGAQPYSAVKQVIESKLGQ
ncbi:DsbA family protein [Candidatus Nanohalococcus occultus]|uniref:DsbA family protein n=1 Tax=Candidatus Nanohalococcus occultus TaxID=2978047 RepID=UPI0039E0D576